MKFVIPWAEVTRLERVSTGLMTDMVRVMTRRCQRDFSMFLSLDEAFGVIGQLADIALRRLLDSEGLELDRVLQQSSNITKRSAGNAEKVKVVSYCSVKEGRGFCVVVSFTLFRFTSSERIRTVACLINQFDKQSFNKVLILICFGQKRPHQALPENPSYLN